MTTKKQYGYIRECQICRHAPLSPVLDLGHHAPVHAHVTDAGLQEPQTSFPLVLNRCDGCGLLQLDYIANPNIIFYPDYPYFTGMTNMLVRNFRELRDILMEQYNIKQGDLVIDIGSNDGTLLQGFKEKGTRVLGIEPTKVAIVARENGIPTLQEFFTTKTAEQILEQDGKAKAVTATNMFAHVDNPFELARAIYSLLTDDGVFVSESQYLVDMIEKSALDTIYHEHLRYYSLKPLQKLLSLAGMSIVDAEHTEAAGGSIRVYAMKGDRPMSDRAKQLMEKEEKLGLYDGNAFVDFAKNMRQVKHDLLELLIACKKKGRIVGIGAPGRSNTLLNFAHINTTLLDYAAEKKGSPKIGLYTPGMHIPIVDEERVFEEQPEFALLLSWHIGDELIDIYRKKGYKGTFITPFPRPKII